MKLREQIAYPADIDAVFTMLCDPAYRRRVCAATYAIDHRVAIQPRGDIVAVTIVRVMPADVPAMLRPVVGDRIEIQQTEQWSTTGDGGQRTADLAVQILGQPAHMSGTIALGELGGATVGTIEGELHVRVPFFGGRLADEMVRAFRFALTVEADVARDYLAR